MRSEEQLAQLLVSWEGLNRALPSCSMEELEVMLRLEMEKVVPRKSYARKISARLRSRRREREERDLTDAIEGARDAGH